MSTFTRIVQESLGGVSVVNTYSMRGDFTPADAFKALAKAHPEDEPAKPEPVTLATPRPPTPPMDHFVDPVDIKREILWRTVMDERTRQHAVWPNSDWEQTMEALKRDFGGPWPKRFPCLMPHQRDAFMSEDQHRKVYSGLSPASRRKVTAIRKRIARDRKVRGKK